MPLFFYGSSIPPVRGYVFSCPRSPPISCKQPLHSTSVQFAGGSVEVIKIHVNYKMSTFMKKDDNGVSIIGVCPSLLMAIFWGCIDIHFLHYSFLWKDSFLFLVNSSIISRRPQSKILAILLWWESPEVEILFLGGTKVATQRMRFRRKNDKCMLMFFCRQGAPNCVLLKHGRDTGYIEF